MNFKLISKNNVGVVSVLLLVILLSQSKIFNFLIDTALGRTLLIGFILFISYNNQILGIVSVLFMIIMFNNFNFGYMEGFTDASGNPVLEKKIEVEQQKIEKKKEILQNVKPDLRSTNESTTTEVESVETEPVESTSTAVEGFDIIGTENNIKRGKQSNNIPVNKFSNEPDMVSPYEGFLLSESFSSF